MSRNFHFLSLSLSLFLTHFLDLSFSLSQTITHTHNVLRVSIFITFFSLLFLFSFFSSFFFLCQFSLFFYHFASFPILLRSLPLFLGHIRLPPSAPAGDTQQDSRSRAAHSRRPQLTTPCHHAHHSRPCPRPRSFLTPMVVVMVVSQGVFVIS